MMLALGSHVPLLIYYLIPISHIPLIWFHLLSSSRRAQWDGGVFGLNLRLLLISCLANLCAPLDNKFYIYVKQKQTWTESHIGLTICCPSISLSPCVFSAPDNMSFVPKFTSVLRFFPRLFFINILYISLASLLSRFQTICYRICLCLFRMPNGTRVLFCCHRMGWGFAMGRHVSLWALHEILHHIPSHRPDICMLICCDSIGSHWVMVTLGTGNPPGMSIRLHVHPGPQRGAHLMAE